MPTAVVVIPTRNEEKSIEGVIAEVRSAFAGLRYDRVEILLTDDSIDGTRAVARRAGAHVVNGGGEGLGAAMYRGLKEALAFDPDVILTIDGDGQSDAKDEIPRFLGVLERDEADLVLGSRFQQSGLVRYKYKFVNRMGTRLLVHFLNAKTGLGLTDSHGGIRAMRAAVARELQMIGSHTYVQETIIDAAEKGFRIVELPSAWRARQHGSSRVVGSIPKYVFYTLPIILLRSGHHVRTLYNTGLLLIAAAFVYFGVVVVEEGFTLAMGHRTPAFVLIALLISTGIQLFFFGFMLQLLNQIKRSVDRVVYPTGEKVPREPPPPARARVAQKETQEETTRV